MRSSGRLRGKNIDNLSSCKDSKDCTCVLCYFKYVHRIWFALQTRLLVMYSLKDRELCTISMTDKFATSAEDATACRAKFMTAHGIVRNDNKIQKRKDWGVKDSSARALGTLEDLIYMWYNMDMSLPNESYQHASMHPPYRHHPLPYLPEVLRVMLYPLLAAKAAGKRQMCRFLGATPPHPTFKVEFKGRAVELSATITLQCGHWVRRRTRPPHAAH